jgi:hypothetical protein
VRWFKGLLKTRVTNAGWDTWLSVVWAVYAAVLAAIGFLRRSSVTRWAALALFALTIVKGDVR